jgi:hypothetical protein
MSDALRAGYCRYLLAGALLLQACGMPNGGGCIGARGSPIYYGSAEPTELDLTRGERSAIGLVMPETKDAACTGVLLPDGWVLTARHCASGAPLLFQTSDASARSVAIVGMKPHPVLDVMLLELDDQFASLDGTPISLWTGPIDETWIGTRATLAGLGETESGVVGELRFADEEVVAVDDVALWVDGTGASGACVGDSGGPLLVAAEDGSARVAGVLDRGSQNCLGMDVYTRMDGMLEWIIRITATRQRTCAG